MRCANDRKRRAKAGVTLVEVMLAGAMTSLVVLSMIEGFIVATKIAHENAVLLQADNDAFDYLWNRFNEDYENLKTLNEQIFDPHSTNIVTQTTPTGVYRTKAQITDPSIKLIYHNPSKLYVIRSSIPEKRDFSIPLN
jgi:hypothetical protein